MTALVNPSPLVTYTVGDPRPITRGESDSGAIIVAGDAVGLYDMAAAGLLNTTSAIYYSSSLDQHPAQLNQLLRSGAALVLTDTNRKQAFRWDTFVGDYGYTETAADHPQTNDPSDSPIELTPGAPLDSKTSAAYIGAVDVTASSYGNADSYTPEDDAYAAIDNNLDTSWTTGIGVPDPVGQWWQVKTARPISADQVTLVQPQNGNTSRAITKVTLTFDGRHPLTVNLGPSSLTVAGQRITFGTRSFTTLRVRIDATSDDNASSADATSIGFAEVEVPNLSVFEVVKLPTDLLKATGPASINNRLTIDLARAGFALHVPLSHRPRDHDRPRVHPAHGADVQPHRDGKSVGAHPRRRDRPLVGQEAPWADQRLVVAYSKGRLPGDLAATASAAADGNPGTAWQPGFGAPYQKGQWLEYDLKKPITFDHLDLQVMADGRHSVPTSIEVSASRAPGDHPCRSPCQQITTRHAEGPTVRSR